jgi:hypothetical protein
MSEFLKFVDEKVRHYPMHIEITYCKICDWMIHIFKAKCGENGADLEILTVQHCDMELCFAKAHVKLKEWLLENEGGY